MDYIRIFVKGGVISPGQLKKLINIAKFTGNSYLRLGSRQDIFFNLKYDAKLTIAELQKNGFDFEIPDGKYQNITSSYIASDITSGTSWVNSSTFLLVLESLPEKSIMKIGVFDPKQKLVPIFHNNINICAATIPNYWYITLRFSENNFTLQNWPVLVFQDDIATIVREIEKQYINGIFQVHEIFANVNNISSLSNKNINEQLNYPDALEADFEGFELMPGGQKYRLGLYRRNNDYGIAFLDALCDVCTRTFVGKVFLSPWKSLMVKDIELKHRNVWEGLLGTFGINTRHSGFELNWHVPLLNTDAFQLKTNLIKEIDKRDIRTSGLTFTIDNSDSLKFTSVIIQKKFKFKLWKYHFFSSYNVLVAKDFNPNSLQYKLFESDVMEDFLPETIKRISIAFYIEQSGLNEQFKNINQTPKRHRLHDVWECNSCKSVYDKNYGDIVMNISKGVLFEDLPVNYQCSTCGEPKQNFSKKSIEVEL